MTSTDQHTDASALYERMVNRVRGLLSKAESTNFPEEAHALNEKAAQIIAQYGIDSAILADEQNDNGPEIADRFVMIRPPYTIDAQLMLCGLAQAMRVQALILGKVGPDRKVHLFGTQADLDRFMIMWNSLRIQADNLVSQVPANMFESAKTARCNFYAGFRHTVVSRVAGAETHAEGESVAGTSLVLASQAEAVSEAVSVKYPRIRKASGVVKRSATGSYVAGVEAGRNADINNTRISA